MHGAIARDGNKVIGNKRSRSIPGFVRGAGENFKVRNFVNSPSITRTTTTITIRLTAVIGNYYVFTVTTMSTRDIWTRNGMTRKRRVASKNRLPCINRSPTSILY